MQFGFIVCRVEGYQNILKLSCRRLGFTSYKTFLKNKKEVWNQSPCLDFCMIFDEEYFSCYILLTEQFHCLVAFTSRDIGEYCCFSAWPNSQDKILNILRMKRAFKMIVYKKTDIERQRLTTSDNEWYNKWQRVTRGNTTSDNEWQQIAMSDSEWQQWYNQWKQHSTLQRMDDCRPFNDKNRYTATSRDGWLQLEWLNK